MVEKLAILDHLHLHRDRSAEDFFEVEAPWKDPKYSGPKQEYTTYMGEKVDVEDSKSSQNVDLKGSLYLTLKHLVSHEMIGSPNTPEKDLDYFSHIYMMLYCNEVNNIRQDAYEEARKQVRSELKRRVRDDPDLIRKLKVHRKE